MGIYGTTLVSLIPPLGLGSIFMNLEVGTDLSDVDTSWFQTSLGVLHKSIQYIYKVFQHLDAL